MGLEFIDRTLKVTGIVLLIFLPFGLYYLGIYPSLAVLSGGVWGMINLIFTSALIRATITPEGVNKLKAASLAMFKFPLLYFSGYCLTQVPQFGALYLLGGFSALFVIMVLRAIGIAMMQATDEPKAGRKIQGIA